MFAPYTSLDRCIGKEITVRVGGENFAGMLVGVYTMAGSSILVITPMQGGGMEQHIPLAGTVVTVKNER